MPNKENTQGQVLTPLEQEDLGLLADLFKAFGDVTRIRILHALSQQETCVNDLAGMLGMTQSAVSHQLKILRQNRLMRAGTANWSITASTTIMCIRCCRWASSISWNKKGGRSRRIRRDGPAGPSLLTSL